MAKACPVKIALPQLVKNLVADVARIAAKVINVTEIAVNDLAAFSPETSDDNAHVSDDWFHVLSV
jgi:hypothetical protein